MPDVNLPLPFEAYVGTEPYIFVSYAHKDAALVYPEITVLHNQGYRIWYDEGIDPGNEWTEEIAKSLENCAHFLVFITPSAVASNNVQDEIHFAIENHKPMLIIHLVETTVPGKLKLRIGRFQHVMAYQRMSEYYRKQMGRGLPDSLKRSPANLASEPGAGSMIEKPRDASSAEPPPPSAKSGDPSVKTLAPPAMQSPAAAAPFQAAPPPPKPTSSTLSTSSTGSTSSRPETGAVKSIDLGGGVSMNLVYIRGGSFTMGSPSNEKDRSRHENQVQVTLTKDFWLGETVVTQEQWEAVMGSPPPYFKGDGDLPVEGVSWDEAVAFCEKLGARASSPAMKFSLPTEAQWEYACRAGSTTRFCFGDSDSGLGEYAWISDNSGGKAHPVKKKKANAWGLYDMHGNVWECCSDWLDDTLRGGPDPLGAPSGSYRVIRGGWYCNPAGCRSANRMRTVPTVRSKALGFRVAAVQQVQ